VNGANKIEIDRMVIAIAQMCETSITIGQADNKVHPRSSGDANLQVNDYLCEEQKILLDEGDEDARGLYESLRTGESIYEQINAIDSEHKKNISSMVIHISARFPDKKLINRTVGSLVVEDVVRDWYLKEFDEKGFRYFHQVPDNCDWKSLRNIVPGNKRGKFEVTNSEIVCNDSNIIKYINEYGTADEINKVIDMQLQIIPLRYELYRKSVIQKRLELILKQKYCPQLLPYGRYCFTFDKIDADSRKIIAKFIWGTVLVLFAILHEFNPEGKTYAIIFAVLGITGAVLDSIFDNFAEDYEEQTASWYWAYWLGYVPTKTFISIQQTQTHIVINSVKTHPLKVVIDERNKLTVINNTLFACWKRYFAVTYIEKLKAIIVCCFTPRSRAMKLICFIPRAVVWFMVEVIMCSIIHIIKSATNKFCCACVIRLYSGYTHRTLIPVPDDELWKGSILRTKYSHIVLRDEKFNPSEIIPHRFRGTSI
jgi:hypothetical protein